MDDIEEIASTFLTSVEVEKLSLKNLPNYIFFCGGGMSNNELLLVCEEQGSEVKSLRSSILNYLSRKEKTVYQDIILAEKFHDWLDDANISNLIDFEMLLAGLASSVVLIVEGPGAYAELGTFSVLPEISSKLVTIYNTNDVADGERSFIEWGPIKYLENNGETVLRHEWQVIYKVEENKISRMIENNLEFQSLVDLIGKQLAEDIKTKIKYTSPFSKINHSDMCLLVADLIYVFSALKLREIKTYINDSLNINLEEKRLKEYLYSLKKLGLVREKNAGAKYFLPTNKNQGFIKYQFKKGTSKESNLSSSSVKANLLSLYMQSDIERTYAMGLKGRI